MCRMGCFHHIAHRLVRFDTITSVLFRAPHYKHKPANIAFKPNITLLHSVCNQEKENQVLAYIRHINIGILNRVRFPRLRRGHDYCGIIFANKMLATYAN